jgi:hypothetical protein
MVKKYERPVEGKSIEDLISSKIESLPQNLTEAEIRYIGEQLEKRNDDLHRREMEELTRELKPHLELLGATRDDEHLHRAIRARGPSLSLLDPGQTDIPKAQLAHRNELLSPGCNGYLTSPPYSIGSPLIEKVGEPAIPIGEPVNFHTGSSLALWEEGLCEVGVAFGKYPGSAIFPEREFGIDEANHAGASLYEYSFISLGEAFDRGATVKVTVDVEIGDPSKSFFFLIPAQGPLVGVLGEVTLFLVGQFLNGDNVSPRVRKVFLFRVEDSQGPITSVEPLRNFTISTTMPLKPDADKVLACVGVSLNAFRLFGVGPVEEREGFAMIDLRSPDRVNSAIQPSAPEIHSILEPAGPVKIPKISFTYCPLQEVQIR